MAYTNTYPTEVFLGSSGQNLALQGRNKIVLRNHRCVVPTFSSSDDLLFRRELLQPSEVYARLCSRHWKPAVAVLDGWPLASHHTFKSDTITSHRPLIHFVDIHSKHLLTLSYISIQIPLNSLSYLPRLKLHGKSKIEISNQGGSSHPCTKGCSHSSCTPRCCSNPRANGV